MPHTVDSEKRTDSTELSEYFFFVMTMKVCYDVWIADLPVLGGGEPAKRYPGCQEGETIIRFSKLRKLPSHPVCGQVYVLDWDPLTTHNRHEFDIEESGYLDHSDEDRVEPYFVIADDYWCHYVLWRQHQLEDSLPCTIQDWHGWADKKMIPEMTERFKSQGWYLEGYQVRGW